MAEAPQKGDFHRLLDSAVIDRRYRKSFTIVTDGQGRTNLHRALRRRSFFVVFRLFKKVNRRLVVIVFQKVGSFIQTNAAWSAGRIHVPRFREVPGVVCLVYLPFLQALSGDFGRHQEQYAAGLCGGQFSSAFLKQSRNLLAV